MSVSSFVCYIIIFVYTYISVRFPFEREISLNNTTNIYINIVLICKQVLKLLKKVSFKPLN